MEATGLRKHKDVEYPNTRIAGSKPCPAMNVSPRICCPVMVDALRLGQFSIKEILMNVWKLIRNRILHIYSWLKRSKRKANKVKPTTLDLRFSQWWYKYTNSIIFWNVTLRSSVDNHLYSSETVVHLYQTARHYITEDNALQNAYKHNISQGSIMNSYHINFCNTTFIIFVLNDRLCGLVVRVSGYRTKDPGFDSRPYQIFWEVGGLKWGPLKPREDNRGATWMKQLWLRSKKPRLTAVGIRCADHATPSTRKGWH
jgi:hypothetical protein